MPAWIGPTGTAKRIPAGSKLYFQVHYTPSGKDVVDRPLIGFTVAQTPPEKQWISYGISAGGPKFAIPPNDGNYSSPPMDAEFTTDVELVQMMPHMHFTISGQPVSVRCKDHGDVNVTCHVHADVDPSALFPNSRNHNGACELKVGF